MNGLKNNSGWALNQENKKNKKALDKILKKCYNKYVIKQQIIKKEKRYLHMAKTNEMTNLKALQYVLEMELPEDVREKVKNMATSLEKKSANRKPKDNSENLALANKIVDILESKGSAMTATEIFTEDTSLKSTPKVTSLLKVLIEQGRVVRTEVKGKPFFELA